jgi:hypothetical protein
VRFLLQNRAVNDIEDKHYNIYDGLPEKREALERWEQELRSLMDAAPAVSTGQPPKSTCSLLQAGDRP